MNEVKPDECPVEVECGKCGEEWEIQSSHRWTYNDDGTKDTDKPKYDIPTSKRRSYIVFCTCGRRLIDILDPDWPTGASGGYAGNR